MDDAKPLTGRQERAARMVAEDHRSDEAIAAAVRICKRTLERWKKIPAFAARVAALRNALYQAALEEGIADRRYRMHQLATRAAGLYRIIDARAADEHFQRVPGGSTGLLTRRPRVVGRGDTVRVMSDYQVDVPAVALERFCEATGKRPARVHR